MKIQLTFENDLIYKKKYVKEINVEKIKIMVIDDSNTIRKSAEMFLTKAGYQVVCIEDGFEALSKIETVANSMGAFEKEFTTLPSISMDLF